MILDNSKEHVTQLGKGNVIFAVMQIAKSGDPVCEKLGEIHATQSVYSYGISDAPTGIFLYAPGHKTGVQVMGRVSPVNLPAPFDQVPALPGHEVHDKFVICGLNGNDPVVYCGSSNLASGGERQNGDNLLAIHDADIATAFAIEALGLIDHYNWLDRWAKPKTPKKKNVATKGRRAKKTAQKSTRTKKAKKVAAAKPRQRKKGR